MNAIKLILTSVLIVGCISCQQVSKRKVIKNPSMMRLTGQVKQDDSAKDSLWRSYMKQLNEPEISNIHVETFRFDFERSFAPDILFRIQQYTDDSIYLISKIIFNCPPYTTITMTFKGKKYSITKDIAVDSISQKVSKKEWLQFYDIVSGSYYWALNNICPNGYSVFDGDNVTLESQSWICGYNQLMYHRVSIHDPKKGSFRSALEYLIRLSNLTKHDKSYLKWLKQS
ncbi:MAG: hypothetical protein JSU01_03260 [Bacteroidetes bacterium]|nr:hypothetical protein [Bacteroidota bacterium]